MALLIIDWSRPLVHLFVFELEIHMRDLLHDAECPKYTYSWSMNNTSLTEIK